MLSATMSWEAFTPFYSNSLFFFSCARIMSTWSVDQFFAAGNADRVDQDDWKVICYQWCTLQRHICSIDLREVSITMFFLINDRKTSNVIFFIHWINYIYIIIYIDQMNEIIADYEICNLTIKFGLNSVKVYTTFKQLFQSEVCLFRHGAEI